MGPETRLPTAQIETQNVNVGACRFYAAMGCQLGAVSRFAYRGATARLIPMKFSSSGFWSWTAEQSRAGQYRRAAIYAG